MIAIKSADHLNALARKGTPLRTTAEIFPDHPRTNDVPTILGWLRRLRAGNSTDLINGLAVAWNQGETFYVEGCREPLPIWPAAERIARKAGRRR